MMISLCTDVLMMLFPIPRQPVHEGGVAPSGATPPSVADPLCFLSTIVTHREPPWIHGSGSAATTPGASVALGSGATLKDSATLSGGYNPSGSIPFTLRQGSCTGPVVDSVQVAVSGAGTYSTPADDVAVGSYQSAASYSGDGNNDGVASTCGDEPVAVQYGA